jgi:hypothetical protein
MTFETSDKMLRHIADEPKLLALFEYWDRKRAGEAMPDRGAIDPVEIDPELLPHLLLYEGVQPGSRAKYRMVGTEIALQFGRDPTGKFLDEVLSGSYLDYIVSLLHDVCLHSTAVYSESGFRWNEGGFQRTRCILLPLSWRGDSPGLVLSGQIFGPLVGPIRPPLTRIHGSGKVQESIRESDQPIGATVIATVEPGTSSGSVASR